MESREIAANAVSVTLTGYCGWHDCILLGNGQIEVVVVPAIGRVMQLRRQGDQTGCFWTNPELAGKLHTASRDEWVNFGGDKCWPAPQSEWPRCQGRDWPPPLAFDAKPVFADVRGNGVVLTSEIDSGYGIQVVRYLELEANLPVLRIRTVFHKVAGSPVSVSVWTVTQLRDPELVALQTSARSHFAEGFNRLIPSEPLHWKHDGEMLSLARHPQERAKIGTEGSAMVWVGREAVLRVESEVAPSVAAERFPDDGCRSEIYTNPDFEPYVELETLGPLVNLRAGESTEHTTRYTLLPRTMADATEEARSVLLQKL